jgi:hypothetical protein
MERGVGVCEKVQMMGVRQKTKHSENTKGAEAENKNPGRPLQLVNLLSRWRFQKMTLHLVTHLLTDL